MRILVPLLVCLLLAPLGTAAQSAADGLLITEIFADPLGVEAEEEWFEIGNVGPAPVALGAVKVGDAARQGSSEGMAAFPEEALLPPLSAIVVAQSAVGFQRLYGRPPDYELRDTDPAVPDMIPFRAWSGGELALANSGDDLLLLGAGLLVLDGVNYGDNERFFSPPVQTVPAGYSLARVPADCDTDAAVDWQPLAEPTPGVLDFEGECLPPLSAAVDQPLPPIGEIQGAGEVSPHVNGVVTLRGVVTGFYSEQNSRGVVYYTAFLQDLPGAEDGDPRTSDGIALFMGRTRPLFAIGDQLRVTGTVLEYYGLTELEVDTNSIRVEGTDHPLPPPIPLPHPPAAVDASYALEPWEGMRVMLASPALVVNPTYSSCGFTVWPYQQAPARMFRREMTDPGGPLLGVLHETDLNCGTFPDVKTGDRVEGISGPLLYHFEEFKVVQQEAAALGVTAVPLPPLPEPPALSQNQFSLATFNMENHFDGVDDTGDPAEPKPSAAAIAVKQAKLAAAISEILGCPTLIGVQEVEKELLLAELAALAADACGFNYAVTHLDSPDARGIDVALLSDPRRVVITAAELRQGCTPLETNTVDPEVFCPAGEDPLFSRPPLLVRLTVDGQPLAVIVNHFKSKRGGELATAARREAQAAHVRRLTQEILADDPDAWVVVLGDFNDYERSPALAQLQLGLVDLLARIPADSRYTFLFSGRAQLIDGMLASPALAAAVEGVRIQHVNADYPAAWGAVVDGRKLLYRATDHDLPLAVINLPDSADGEMKPVPAEATAAVPPTAVTDDAATPRRWLVFLIPASGAGLIIWWSRRRKKRTHVDA